VRKIAAKASKKAGQPPGTLVYTGNNRIEDIKITTLDYNETQFQERTLHNIEECLKHKDKDKDTVTWINVEGVHDISIVEKIGNYFDIHPMLMEDIVNVHQRSKIENYEEFVFMVIKMISLESKTEGIEKEQFSLILGSDFVISFHEKTDDIFNQIRERIRKASGTIRKMGADYLAYTLIDVIVDNYFVVLEKIGEMIDDVESELIENPTPKTLHAIHYLKKEVIQLRNSIWPMREIYSKLDRTESKFIHQATAIYYKDLHEHTIEVIEIIETYRDIIYGMIDIYISSVSNKMNEIMKVLTIISTVFIPLTFIAGVYGMNFINMPEIQWRYGYPVIMVVMLIISLLMLANFKRKKWL